MTDRKTAKSLGHSPSRTERDSMGELQVPADALWGAQTQRALQNFALSGLTLPRQFIRALGLVKWAAAGANRSLELLPADVATAIEAASLAVAAGEYDPHFPVDVFQTGSGTSSNMNANEVIAHVASKALGKAVVLPVCEAIEFLMSREQRTLGFR